jgi:hypothetical protein
MSTLDNIRLLIEALRGGNTADQGIAATKSQRSTYNPQGIPMQADSSMSVPLGGQSSPPGSGIRDPEYLKYVKSQPAGQAMSYMEWLEKGG